MDKFKNSILLNRGHEKGNEEYKSILNISVLLHSFFHVTVGNLTGQNEIGSRTEIIIHIFRLFEYK